MLNRHHFRDLLSKDGEKLDIKINPDGTGQLHVPGLRIIEVKSFQHIKKVTQHTASLARGELTAQLHLCFLYDENLSHVVIFIRAVGLTQ